MKLAKEFEGTAQRAGELFNTTPGKTSTSAVSCLLIPRSTERPPWLLRTITYPDSLQLTQSVLMGMPGVTEKVRKACQLVKNPGTVEMDRKAC